MTKIEIGAIKKNLVKKTKIYEEILLHVIDLLYEQGYLLEEERTPMKSHILFEQSRKDGRMQWRG